MHSERNQTRNGLGEVQEGEVAVERDEGSLPGRVAGVLTAQGSAEFGDAPDETCGKEDKGDDVVDKHEVPLCVSG